VDSNPEMAPRIISAFNDTATMATLLTAGNVYYEVVFARINMEFAPVCTGFYFLTMTLALILGLKCVIVAVIVNTYSEAFKLDVSVPNWRCKQLCFALHCKAMESKQFQSYNWSCFLWISSQFVATRVKYTETNAPWMSATWAVIAFIMAFYFWFSARRYKHEFDGEHQFGSTLPVPGLFVPDDAKLQKILSLAGCGDEAMSLNGTIEAQLRNEIETKDARIARLEEEAGNHSVVVRV